MKTLRTGRRTRCLRKCGAGAVEKCSFCFQSHESELECGDIKRDKNQTISVHYFCLLFASDLVQKNNFDDQRDPLVGFTIQRIRRQRKKAATVKCIYCDRSYATVRCWHVGCNARFHLACGREKGSFHEFFNEFRSFCAEHAPQTKATQRFGEPNDAPLPSLCSMCLQPFTKSVAIRKIVVSSCCPNAVFHSICAQNFAISAGAHHLQCPLCKDKDEFRNDMLDGGIYIPDRDASWENGDAFADLYQRPDQCAALRCTCPDGRNYAAAEGTWMLTYCALCGSKACHIGCADSTEEATASTSTDESRYTCSDCGDVSVPLASDLPRAASVPRSVKSGGSFKKSQRAADATTTDDDIICIEEYTSTRPHPTKSTNTTIDVDSFSLPDVADNDSDVVFIGECDPVATRPRKRAGPRHK